MSKLDPNALKCIFLGYSHVQKGYQCYCPILGLYFVPIDVTFFDISLFSLSSIVTSRGGGGGGGGDDDLLLYIVSSPTPTLAPVLVKPPITQVYSWL